MALTDKLTAIGNAIRGKTGGTELLTLDEMATAIEGIESGGGGFGFNTKLKAIQTDEIIVGQTLFTNIDFATALDNIVLVEE